MCVCVCGYARTAIARQAETMQCATLSWLLLYTTTTTTATAGQGTDSAVRKERAETMQYAMLSWLLLHNNNNSNR